jgi:hypothetical protein
MMPHRRLTSDTTSRLVSAIAALLALAVAGCSDLSPTSPASAKNVDAITASFDRATPIFSFTLIDVPGALATSPQGINAAGDIVGIYADATSHTHGFLLHQGTFTTIDYRDPVTQAVADNSDARGIGPDGDIVGSHWNDGEETVAAHGYHRTPDGQFVPVHFPGHLYEFPQRILADGTILGCRHDHDLMSSMRGIMIHGSDAAEATNIFASMNNGATPDGHIVVGLYTNMMMTPARGEAYVIVDADTTTFIVPGSLSTAAWDVNPRGDIVGVFRDATGFHGYVRTGTGRTLADAQYTPIDVQIPGVTATRAFGTNARGDVVGAYVVGTGRNAVTHGYLATRVR